MKRIGRSAIGAVLGAWFSVANAAPVDRPGEVVPPKRESPAPDEERAVPGPSEEQSSPAPVEVVVPPADSSPKAPEAAESEPALPAEPDRAVTGPVALPEVEIRGEIEKPDIFFLLPKARDQTDEQVIRSRLRREITKPLVREWLEEELLLE